MQKLQAKPSETINQFQITWAVTQVKVENDENGQAGKDPGRCFEPDCPAVKKSRGEEEDYAVENVDTTKKQGKNNRFILKHKQKQISKPDPEELHY